MVNGHVSNVSVSKDIQPEQGRKDPQMKIPNIHVVN